MKNIKYKILSETQLATNEEREKWNLLLQGIKSEKRKKSIQLSRQVLSDLFSSYNINLPASDFFVRPTCLSEYFKYSLTHSSYNKKLIAAAAATDDPQYQSIGIDLEDKKRPISKEVEEKIQSTLLNSSQIFNSIQIWTQLEAAFKALSPLVPDLVHPLELKINTDKKIASFMASKHCAQIEMIDHPLYSVSVAWIPSTAGK